MNKEEQFKEHLQRLVESKEFPFDEAHWESARDFIDAKRKDQRNRWIYFTVAALFILGTGWTVLTLNHDNEIRMAQTASDPDRTELPSASSLAEITPHPDKKSTRTPSAKSLNGIMKDNAPPAVAEKGNEPSVIRGTNRPGKTGTAVQEVSVAKNEAGQVTNNEQSVLLPVNPPAVTQPVSTFSSGGTEDQEDDGDQRHNRSSEVMTAEKSTLPVGLSTRENKPTRLPEAEVVKPAVTGDKTEQTHTQEEPLVDTPVKESATVSAVLPDNNQVIPAEITKPAGPPVIVAATPAATAETAPEAQIPSIPDDPKEILWSLEGGVSYLGGWKGDEKRDASGINPVFGINCHDYLTGKLSVSFGAHYNRINNLSNSSVTSRVTRYSLGEESRVTVITPSRLHYITVPLRLHYDLDSKNACGAGYSIAYLLNVEARVEKYNMSMGQRKDEENYTTSGYTEGFRLFDSQVSVFYKRKLFRGLGAKAEFFYGFTDIKDNQFFRSDRFERNLGLKLMLVYDIYRK